MTNPKLLAHHDQLDAAVRDRYDGHLINVHDLETRRTILHTIQIVCDAACAFDNQPERTAEIVLLAVSQVLDSIVRVMDVNG